MQVISRIPALQVQTFAAAQQWFSTMKSAELLFHPDDDPQEIVDVVTNKNLFTAVEVFELRAILAQLFECFGDDVYEACYDVVMDDFQLDCNSRH